MDATSVMMSMPVCGCAAMLPAAGTNGRSRFMASVALRNWSGTICVSTWSPGTVGSTSRPTLVRTAVCGEPSRGMMR